VGHTDRPSVSRRLPAVATSIAQIRAIAIDFANTHCTAEPELISDIALCVSEAATNVVLHAYPDTDGDVAITIHHANHTLTIEISDRGVGTATRTTQPGLGMGLDIVDTLSDATFHSPDGTGTNVTMRFPCKAS
jgi:serine/threonine-protein kinase RsbW